MATSQNSYIIFVLLLQVFNTISLKEDNPRRTIESCEFVKNFKTGLYTKCINKDLEFVPSNISKDTVHLKISYNLISLLDLPYVPILKSLDASHNLIATIQRNTFSNATSLITIDLSWNNISKLEENTFVDLNELADLYLSHNNIKELTIHLFPEQAVLETLDLTKNKLERLSVLDNLASLRVLQLSGNHLQSLKVSTISHLVSLEVLDVSNNNISSGLFDFTDVKFLNGILLNLSYNHVREEVKLIPYLFPNLTRLDITGCGITLHIEDEFEHLPYLKMLYLSGNNLQNFDSDKLLTLNELELLDVSNTGLSSFDLLLFKHLRNLRHLNLSHNKLKIDSLSFNSQLEYLDITNCNIKHYGKSDFECLLVLKMSGNPLFDRNVQILHHLKSINHLEISGCELKSLSRQMIDAWKDVYHLDISNNKIKSLPGNFFTSLTTLKHLDISNNNIQSLPDNFLSSLSALEYLDISRNKLHSMQLRDFVKLPNLYYLNARECGMKISSLNLLSQLHNLQTLVLSGNHMKGVELTNTLPQLEYLDLSNCRLNYFPLVVEMTSLQKLYLSHNNIRSFEVDISSELPMLVVLDLSNCNFDNVSWISIKNNQNRLALNLSGNPINPLESLLGINFGKLSILDLSNCNLNALPESLVLVDVELLNLSYNKIESFNVSLFENSTQLKSLNLIGNPLCYNDEIDISTPSTCSESMYIKCYEVTNYENITLQITMDSCLKRTTARFVETTTTLNRTYVVSFESVSDIATEDIFTSDELYFISVPSNVLNASDAGNSVNGTIIGSSNNESELSFLSIVLVIIIGICLVIWIIIAILCVIAKVSEAFQEKIKIFNNKTSTGKRKRNNPAQNIAHGVPDNISLLKPSTSYDRPPVTMAMSNENLNSNYILKGKYPVKRKEINLNFQPDSPIPPIPLPVSSNTSLRTGRDISNETMLDHIIKDKQPTNVTMSTSDLYNYNYRSLRFTTLRLASGVDSTTVYQDTLV